MVRKFLAVVAFVSAAAAVPASAQSTGTIASRDQIIVTVFGVDALSGKYPVGADGTINYPHLGAIPAAGLKTRDLEDYLTKRLKDAGYLLNPQITVELVQTQNKRVIVTGAVRTPGPQPFAGQLTLFEALALAGSTTAEAGDVVLVVRGDATGGGSADGTGGAAPIEVNLRDLESGRLAAANLTLQDGDQIVVPRAQQVFISGQVRSPGGYNVPSGTTVLQALTLAGGLTDRGTMRGVRILRDKKEVKNVKPDTVVSPGDTIIVKASPF